MRLLHVWFEICQEIHIESSTATSDSQFLPNLFPAKSPCCMHANLHLAAVCYFKDACEYKNAVRQLSESGEGVRIIL